MNWKAYAAAPCVVLVALAALTFPPGKAASAQVPLPAVTAFTGMRLIDGNGGAPVVNATLLVTDGRVTAVGPAASVPVPANARRVDLQGKTVMPGLVNAHGHVQVEQGSSLPVRDDLLRRLRLYAQYGVTTVVSLGSGAADEVPGIALREEQRAGQADGARLFTAGQAVVGRTPEAARASVDRLADLGVDFVKLRLNGNANDPDQAALQAQVQRAQQRGLRTAIHIFDLADAQRAVEVGVDVVGHSVRDRDVTPAFIQLMKARGAHYVPTLTRDLSVFVYESRPAFFEDPFFLRGRAVYAEQMAMLSDPARQARVQADANAQAIKPALEQAKRNLKLLADAGVCTAFGTDSGAAGAPGRWQGYFEHVELELMAEAGLTPAQVLHAATRGAAAAMGLQDVGVLARGKLADFIVLDADPLQDIRNTRRIHSVWMGGQQVEGAASGS